MDWIRDGRSSSMSACGAALSAIELFGERLRRMRFIGTDISSAVDVALDRFRGAGLPGEFVQCDLHALPFRDGSCDIVFSEGVLHHTDSTKRAFDRVVRLVKPSGCIMFYVYRKKGPVREFTDDHIRAQLRNLPPDKAWRAIEPLTKLGIALGKLKATVDIEEDIPLPWHQGRQAGHPALLLLNVAKTFYRPEMSFEEMAHINFDWFAPANATAKPRPGPSLVPRGWLQIEREVIEEAGITIIARRPG
jgi:SAM-dependent methyltransferase